MASCPVCSADVATAVETTRRESDDALVEVEYIPEHRVALDAAYGYCSGFRTIISETPV